jgi:hypothetical protein
MGVLTRRTKREFTHIQRAEIESTGRIQSLQHGRRRARRLLSQNSRAARRNLALAEEHVLVRQRKTCERPLWMSLPPRSVRKVRAGQGLFTSDIDKGIEMRLSVLNAIQTCLDQLA